MGVRFCSWPTWRDACVLDSQDRGSADTVDFLGTRFAAQKGKKTNYAWLVHCFLTLGSTNYGRKGKFMDV